MMIQMDNNTFIIVYSERFAYRCKRKWQPKINVFFANFTLGKVMQQAWLDKFDTLALKREMKSVF